MKKSLVYIVLFAVVAFLSGCGGGSGPASSPNGVNEGVPSAVQLLPIQSIAQTNSSIYLKAKVLDGNGSVLPGVQVAFTNLSQTGTLSSTVAKTDSMGMATVTLFSGSPGFATVQAEVGSGAGHVRDKKTVFFSIFDFTLPPEVTPSAGLPTLTLDVDGNANGIFNEPDDFILFQNQDDSQAIVRATVLDSHQVPAAGVSVSFSSDSTEITFPLGSTKTADENGQALVLIQADPAILRSFTTAATISAVAGNGAANMVTLFLEPVFVDKVLVIANPQTVQSGGSSDISALVTTTAGSPVPDGTTVEFSASQGRIPPFGQTTDGLASVTYTAPQVTSNTSATISANVGGKGGTVSVSITPSILPLSVLPANVAVTGIPNPDTDPSDNILFTILGGVGPYQIFSDHQTVIPNQSVFGGAFTVDPNSVNTATTVLLTIVDSRGATTTATVIVNPQTFIVSPAAVTIPVGGSVTMTIIGGTPPFLVFADIPDNVTINHTADQTFFTVVGNKAGGVTITVRDSTGRETTARVTVQ